MNTNDFFFSYKISLKSQFLKKKYFKFLSKIFSFPYKFLLFRIKTFFKVDKVDLDKLEKLNISDLDQLFIYFNTDKGSRVKIIDKFQKGHNYSKHYEKYFSKFRDKEELKILEIGSLFGGGSASFLNYFTSANIVCLDINPFNLKFHSKKFRSIYIDTQLRVIIRDVANYIKHDFDIIIDDGSHNKKDQILALNYFLPKLKSGGIYVIEDTTQYLQIPSLNQDNLEYGVNEFLISIKKNGNHKTQFLNEIEKKKIQSEIKNFFLEEGNFFHKNQSLPEIIFIEKN